VARVVVVLQAEMTKMRSGINQVIVVVACCRPIYLHLLSFVLIAVREFGT